MDKTSVSLSVILPVYNEEENIENTIKHVFHILPLVSNDFEVIAVDDGSRDNTYRVLSNLKAHYKGLYIIRHNKNRGYGSALTSGFKKADKEYIFFMDSDGQFDFNDIWRLLIFKDYDIVAGIRIERKDTVMRDLIGTIFNFIVKFLYKVPIMDIDCGFKLFKKSVIKELTLHSEGALINTEILVRARMNNRSLMLVGVNHYPRKKGNQSGANWRVISRAMVEMIKLKYKLINT